jgi:cytochrome oxidase Cu insertion factor (SCO1/SenC/PrrC family)
MTRRALVTALALGFIVAASCGQTAIDGGADQPYPREGDRAPDFSLPDAQGPPVSLADYRGKKDVLLYFSMGPG